MQPVLLLILGLAVDSAVSYITNDVCPKKFKVIGRKCYHFSKDEVTWHDAHHNCLNLNSTLAIVTRSHQELLMRQFLLKNSDVLGKYERWLGGRYDWKLGKWVWGATGKPLVFQGFSRMNANDPTKWNWHCIIIDPARMNKWGARSCFHKKRYVCQTPTNKYMTMKRDFREHFDKKRCDVAELTGYEKQLCSKWKSSNAAPAYLVKKPKHKHRPGKYKNFVCREHMILVGRKCYFFSLDRANWNDAYWACRSNSTMLATINNKLEDNILRGFLKGNFVERHERWLAGIFDWKQNKWKWAKNGREIKYKNFIRSEQQQIDKENNRITIDPNYDYLWNSKNSFDQKHYICQAKAKTVVKYEKPVIYEPDATVVIALNNTLLKTLAPTTETSPVNRSPSTDKYIYN